VADGNLLVAIHLISQQQKNGRDFENISALEKNKSRFDSFLGDLELHISGVGWDLCAVEAEVCTTALEKVLSPPKQDDED